MATHFELNGGLEFDDDEDEILPEVEDLEGEDSEDLEDNDLEEDI